jgi:cell division protein FtsB
MSVNYNEWVIYALVFFLGLVLGMAAMAGGKWKGRYKAEVRRREELEAENKRLRKENGEMSSLREAAARDEAKRRTDGPGPL